MNILRFTGDYQDMQKLDDAHSTILTNDAVFEYVLNTGNVPSQDEYNALKQKTMGDIKKKGKDRFIDMPSTYFGDTEFEFDIILDEEQEPIATLAQNTFQLLTAIGQNPALLTQPVTKALIYDWAEKVGISPIKLEIAEAQTPSQPQQGQQSQQPAFGQQPPMSQMMMQAAQDQSKQPA